MVAASLSLGVVRYTWKALLSHFPNILMNESSKPVSAVVVAAPILKLWPRYCLDQAYRVLGGLRLGKGHYRTFL